MVNFDKYMTDIEEYITEKIPDIKPSTRLEIMSFIGYKIVVLNNEIVRDRDDMWKRSFNRECIPRKNSNSRKEFMEKYKEYCKGGDTDE